jgi:hypothetical protein
VPSKAVTCPLFYRLFRNEIRVWIPFHSSNGWFDHGLTKRSGKIDTRLTLTTLLFLEWSERPGVCGVPSERSGCVPYPGFHPGLVCSARWGTPNAPPPQSPHASTHPTPSPQHTWSTIVFSHGRQSPPHRGTGSQATQRQRDRAGASIGTSTP